jgi:hypothetical protein
MTVSGQAAVRVKAVAFRARRAWLLICGSSARAIPQLPDCRALCLPVRGKVQKLAQRGLPIDDVAHPDDPAKRRLLWMNITAEEAPISIGATNQEYRLLSCEYADTDI